MGRPKRSTEQEWLDIFADSPVAEQLVMLRMCEEICRQKRRGKLPQTEPAAAIGEEAQS